MITAVNVIEDEVELKFLNNETVAYNSLYDTSAAIYHGNGPSKVGQFCDTKILVQTLYVTAVSQFPW